MTEQKQTTAERIAEDMGVPLGAAQTIAAEIDALTRERDEAQRIIGIYNTSRDEVIAQLCEMNDALRDERDEARAEVERLQTAAEAFWAYEVFTATYLREDRDKFAAAANRARAAKESQP